MNPFAAMIYLFYQASIMLCGAVFNKIRLYLIYSHGGDKPHSI
jgi:hypothetical protein